jgi:hypothetical protein
MMKGELMTAVTTGWITQSDLALRGALPVGSGLRVSWLPDVHSPLSPTLLRREGAGHGAA